MSADGRPLAGLRLVLTRPREQAGDFEARVRALGGEPLLAPAIAIGAPATWAAADAALRDVARYEMIAFTSANAVRALVERSDALGLERARLGAARLAAVGPATAAALAAAVRPPDLVAETHVAEALAEVIAATGAARVLFPHGDIARDALPAGLRARGAAVDDVVVYRTVPGEGVAAIVEVLREGSADALLFASASAVRFVADALGRAGAAARAGRPAIFCLGPVTAAAARRAGLEPAAVAGEATQDELVADVARWFAARRREPMQRVEHRGEPR